jgi:hypothetical protein
LSITLPITPLNDYPSDSVPGRNWTRINPFRPFHHR